MKESSTGLVFPTRLERRFSLEEQLRVRVWMETIVEEELQVALGVGRYERGPVQVGHRKGSRSRQITTSVGKQEIRIPRGEYFESDAQGHW